MIPPTTRPIWISAMIRVATAMTPRKTSLIALCRRQIARLGLLVRVAALVDGRRDRLFALLDHLAARIDHRVDGRTPLVDGRNGGLLALLHRVPRFRGRSRCAVLRIARAVADIAARVGSGGWGEQERAGGACGSAEQEHQQTTAGIVLLLNGNHGALTSSLPVALQFPCLARSNIGGHFAAEVRDGLAGLLLVLTCSRSPDELDVIAS